MPPVAVLIKPVSAACELRCTYCFYRDEVKDRERENAGVMSCEIAQCVVRRAFDAADGASVTFAFQGGEPLLAGLDFYRAFTEAADRMNVRKSPVSFTLQTNGVAMDESFAAFFAERGFLIGLSLDGPADVHDGCRRDIAGKGSHSRVMRAAALMKKHRVEFNILTVLTDRSARKIGAIYTFMKKQGFGWMQYIPCMAPMGGDSPDALSAEGWLDAHRRLFDLWYADFTAMARTRIPPPSIRYFDNLILRLAGKPAEMCGMKGNCVLQYVIESDGSVYPCDFYALDEFCMGSIKEQSFARLEESDAAKRFLTRGAVRDSQREKCASCLYFPLCGGGCVRYYQNGEYKYCDAVRAFLGEAAGRLAYAAKLALR